MANKTIEESQHYSLWFGEGIRQLSEIAKRRVKSLEAKVKKAESEKLALSENCLRLESEIEAIASDPILLEVKKTALAATLAKIAKKAGEIDEFEQKIEHHLGEKESRKKDKFPRFRDILIAEFVKLFGENASGGLLSFEQIEELLRIPAKNADVGQLVRPDEFSAGKDQPMGFKLISARRQESRNRSVGEVRPKAAYGQAKAAWIATDSETGETAEVLGASEFTRNEANRFRNRPERQGPSICPKCNIVIMGEVSVIRVGREYHERCWP